MGWNDHLMTHGYECQKCGYYPENCECEEQGMSKRQSKATQEHSPLPWNAIETGNKKIGWEEWAIVDKNNRNVLNTDADVQDKANAAFIVRACNSFHSLVALAKEISEMGHEVRLGLIDGQQLPCGRFCYACRAQAVLLEIEKQERGQSQALRAH